MHRKNDAQQLSAAAAAQIYRQGMTSLEAGRYREAIDQLESIANLSNLTGTLARFYLAQAHMRRGILQLNAGIHAEAAGHFTHARRLNPDSSGLGRYIAACYAGQGRFDLAAAEIERSGDCDSGDVDQPIRLAHAFARDGRMQRAVETLVRVIDSQPHRVDVRLQLGLLYGASEQYEDAICVLTEAAEVAPLDPHVQQHLGLSLGAVGDYSLAAEHLAVAQKLRPNDAHVALLLTMSLDAARAICFKVAIDPKTSELTTVDDRSLELLGELIAGDPDFVEAFLRLPESIVDARIFALLAATIERALENRPDYADLYFHASRVYERLGLTESAIAQARMAVDINPRYVQALIQLGRLYIEVNESGEALDRLREAVACGGDFADVHFLLGDLCRREGDKNGACAEFRKALQLNADYRRASEALETVLSA